MGGGLAGFNAELFGGGAIGEYENIHKLALLHRIMLTMDWLITRLYYKRWS